MRFVPLLIVMHFISCAQSQNNVEYKLVGKPCEGCEAIFEYGNKILSSIDTLPDFNNGGMKIKITGKIFQSDGITPARDVILYIYHTDQQGLYTANDKEKGWGKRHGYIRGWIKTGKDGNYSFYTLKPGIYPDRSAPAHIHPTILEPNGKYYYLNSYHFEGDPLLTKNETSPESPRGGSSGLITLRKEGDLWVGKRDFVLGKNIPNYQD